MALSKPRQNRSLDGDQFSLKHIYDGFFHKSSYNPDVPAGHLDYIMNELNVKVDKSCVKYDFLHKLLEICKAWFARTSTKKALYRDFKRHVQLKIRELVATGYGKAAAKENKLTVYHKSVVEDIEGPRRSPDGRFNVTVHCKMSELAGLRMDFTGAPQVTTTFERSLTWFHPPLCVKSLMHWPFIGFVIQLEHMSVTHCWTPSYIRYVRPVGCEEEPEIEKENDMELGVIEDNSKVNRKCRIENVLMYLAFTKAAVEKCNEISKRQKDEFVEITMSILRALTYNKAASCSIDTECCYTSSKYKFRRETDITEDIPVPKKSKGKKTETQSCERGKLVEIMTPTAKLNITRCSFDNETADAGKHQLLKYFEEIQDPKKPMKKAAFIKKMNSAISYMCASCNVLFSKDAFYRMEEHIHEFHGAQTPWYCIKCNSGFDAYQLAMHSYKHICKSKD